MLWSSSTLWGYGRNWLHVAHPASLFSPQPLSSSLQGVWVFGSLSLAARWQGEVKDRLQVCSVCVRLSVFSRLMPKKRQEERKRALKKNNDAWCLIHQEKDGGSPCWEVNWSFASEGFSLENNLSKLQVKSTETDVAQQDCSNFIIFKHLGFDTESQSVFSRVPLF